MTRGRSWLFTVLVLLAGLLGMHGLASEHHMPGTTAPSASTSSATTAMPGAAGQLATNAGHAHLLPAASTAAAVTPVTVVTGEGMVIPHPACVAVLTGSALLLLVVLLRRRPRFPTATPPRHVVRSATAALRPPEPPDLVAGLCVSRT